MLTIALPCKSPHLEYLRIAVSSVLRQSSPSWNLLIVDDGNKDPRVLQELAQLAHADSRITVLPSEAPMVTGALNTAMRHAPTPFICSLHCDDVLADNAVEILCNYINKFPGTDYFHSSWRVIDNVGNVLSDVIPVRENFALEDFKNHGPVKHIHCWNIASALAIGGMDETLGPHGADDYDFSWCMAEAGYTFTPIPECLYYYRDHREHFRLTTHVPLEQQIIELRKIWSKHGMSGEEIAKETERRTAGYLRQALFRDDADRQEKEANGFDIRQGFRQSYRLLE